MKTLLHCICLRVVRHSDTVSIATVWTREKGRVAMQVPASDGREARRKRALMMPFSAFECVGQLRASATDVIRVSDVRPWGCGNASACDPVKNVVALFLSDFLYGVLRESQPDALLTDFIFTSIEMLKEAEGTRLANFHLYFVYRIGMLIGIAPDVGTYRRGYFLDMRDGVFTPSPPLHRSVLSPSEAKFAWLISRLDYGSLDKLRINRRVRNAVLDRLLEYFTLHHAPLASLPSLEILRSIMS